MQLVICFQVFLPVFLLAIALTFHLILSHAFVILILKVRYLVRDFLPKKEEFCYIAKFLLDINLYNAMTTCTKS